MVGYVGLRRVAAGQGRVGQARQGVLRCGPAGCVEAGQARRVRLV
jgi:hypothetical protein